MNEQFKKRLSSFLWRTGMMVLAAVVTFIMDNLGMLQFDPFVVTILGLVLGEVSKAINTQLATN